MERRRANRERHHGHCPASTKRGSMLGGVRSKVCVSGEWVELEVVVAWPPNRRSMMGVGRGRGGGVGRRKAVEMGNMGVAHSRTDDQGGSGLSWSWTPSKLARRQGCVFSGPRCRACRTKGSL